MLSRRALGIVLCGVVFGAATAGAWFSTAPVVIGDWGGAVTEMLVLPGGDIIVAANGDNEAEGSVGRLAGDTAAYTRLAFDGVCPRPHAIARLAGGDLVVSGSRNGNCDADAGDFTVIRYDGATDAPLWSFDVRGRSRALVTGPGDMLIAGGSTVDGDDDVFGVVRLDPSAGTALWTFETAGHRAFALALDANGDVVAGGGLPAADGAFGIVKLAGGSGDELWRDEAGTPGRVTALAVDASGDVLGAGSYEDGPTRHARVVKLDGNDGEVQWSRVWEKDPVVQSVALALAPNGDAVVAASVCDPDCRWLVQRLAAADGTTVWAALDTIDTVIEGHARSVALAIDGDVLVTGRSPAGITTLRLAGVDGTVRWRSDLEPFCPGIATSSQGTVVRPLPSGDVAVGGAACGHPDEIFETPTVATLRGDDGSILPDPMPTTTTTTVPGATTTTTQPPSMCARLRDAGCMDPGAPRGVRRRVAALCSGEGSRPGVGRRLARRAERLARRGRLPERCARTLALHRRAGGG